MSKHIWITAVALLIFVAGCEEYEYTIQMTPDGDAIKRTISFSSNLPDEEKQAVAEIYPEQIDANTFSGMFGVELPNDVGGAGYYTYLVTSMGSTATYKERFRGDDDLNQHIEDFQMFVDQYVDFTIDWLEFELGKEPNFDNLRTFLDRNFRNDAKSVGLYFWLGSVIEQYDSNAVEETKLRAVQYLEERGYIAPGQADILEQRLNRNGEEEICKLAREIVAREIGCCQDGADSGKLGFFDSPDIIEKSVIRYIRSTERYRQMWEKEKISKKDGNLPPPDVDIHKFIAEGAAVPFELDLGNTPYKMNVWLNCPFKPFKTNGQWNEPKGMVCWSAYIRGRDSLPTFYYASWSEPNNDFQSRHFGRIILEGKNLAEYCYWEKSIEEGQVRQWNEFLSGIDPDMEIGTMVKAFRFSGEPVEPNAPSLADLPRSFMLDALSRK